MRYWILTILCSLGFIVKGTARNDNDDNDIKIEIETTIQKQGYVGEVLEYTVYLKSSTPDISSVQVVTEPNFDKHFKVLTGTVPRNATQEKTEKGKKYFVTPILKNYVIADAAGKYKVNETEYVVFVPHIETYQDYFWGIQRRVNYEEKRIKSKGVEVTIKDLPKQTTSGQECSGVGEFEIEGWFPPGEIYAGKEAYVVFSITGYGDLSDIHIPDISKAFAPNQLKEIDRDDQLSQRDGRMFSEVTLTCKFVPNESDFEIKPISFEFFNPNTKKYYKAESLPLYGTDSHVEKHSRKSSNDIISI